MNSGKHFLLTAAAAVLLFVGVAVSSGCERKEEILDIETPNGEIEVERSRNTGDVDVEIND